MKVFLNKCRQLFKDFSWKEVLDALLGGIVYSTLIFVPIYIILVETAMIFMHRLNTFVILITFAAMMNVYTINKLTAKALILKKPDTTTDIKSIWMTHSLIWMTIVFIIGLLFIFVLIPILWV
jgi:hypothetical protein